MHLPVSDRARANMIHCATPICVRRIYPNYGPMINWGKTKETQIERQNNNQGNMNRTNNENLRKREWIQSARKEQTRVNKKTKAKEVCNEMFKCRAKGEEAVSKDLWRIHANEFSNIDRCGTLAATHISSRSIDVYINSFGRWRLRIAVCAKGSALWKLWVHQHQSIYLRKSLVGCTQETRAFCINRAKDYHK